MKISHISGMALYPSFTWPRPCNRDGHISVGLIGGMHCAISLSISRSICNLVELLSMDVVMVWELPYIPSHLKELCKELTLNLT